MKKFLSLFVVMVLVVSSIVAQAPEKFTYQAVVRNANNSLVINSQISVRVNILKGSATGNAVYSESHVTNSNANGLITVNIGGGTVLHGSFVEINWADGPYFLKTDIDPNGGSNYTITSVQQLLSVPYALYAKSAANGFSGDYNDLSNRPQIPQNVSAFTNDAGYITQAAVPTNVSAFQNDARYITMDSVPAIPTVPTNVSAFQNDAGYITQAAVPTNVSQLQNDAGYLTNFTEQQILSISNDTIYLTGGSFVKLPTAEGFSGSYNDLTDKPNLFSGNYNDLTGKPNLFSGDYNDLSNRPQIPQIPQNVSAFTNDAGYITMDSVPSIPANVSAFQNDARYITMDSVPAIPTVPTNVSAFQNDAGYITQAAVPTNVSAFQNDARYITMDSVPAIPTVPTNVSAFQNDAGYITQAAVPTNVSQLQNDAGYLTNFTEQQILSISNDTIYLTGGSFVKLPTAEGFSGSYNDLTDKPNLFSGNYNDLTGKPNLFSGDYNDLSNRPQIPQIPQNVSAFNNDAGYITMDSVPSVPENVSAFTNDAGYITMDSVPAIPTVPTNVSAFQNDAGYITQAAVPTNVSQLQNDAGYLTNFTEQQILSISNDTIYLTGGSFVKLPTAEGFSGSYNDLTDKPNLFSGNYDDLTGKPNLFSGDYNDLSNRPQIPQIPQNVSAFNNDAGYITMDSVPAIPTVPTNVSAFQNDAGYLTGYSETQNLANVTAQGNFAGNQQLKEVADPTDAQDAVTLRYLMGQLSAFSVAIQHQLDSLGRVISAQQAIIDEQQAFIDSVRNNGGDTTPVTPTAFNCGDNLVIGDYSYTTHQYGSQCWMTENLRSASGNYQFGWPGVLEACPAGWHMPNNNDWGTLGANLPSSSVPFGDGDYWTSDLIPWADNEGNTFSYISPTIVQSTRVTLNGDGIACEVHDALQGDCSVSGSLISVRCVRDASGSTTQAPTVTTDSATSVTENAATLNATITNPDNVTITSKGFEYKVSGSIVDTMVEGVGNGGNFTANITGLLAGTEYTCRAYIVYDNQTIYGSEVTFTTNAATPTAFNCGDNLVIGDFSYTTHQYGSQCWMTENLRSASGNYQFGWPGVLEACPAGWHMPNNNDWGTLGANLPSSSVPFGDGDYWTSDIIPWADNEGNSFTLITPTIVQSTSVTLGGNGIACEVHDALQGYCNVSGSLISVRCVREASGSNSQAPTVTTDSATSVTENAATLNGTLSNPDNVTITGLGFEWKATSGDSYTSVTATGSTMNYFLTGLTANTGYTYRAFVSTSSGTSYGNEVTFTTTDIPANSLVMPDPCSADTNATWHPTLSPGSTICVGADSVELALSNYQHGGIQWQYSTDTISWYNIPGAIEPHLTYKPEQTQFVRAVVSYANCPPEYSTVKLLQMSPTAHAGISRTASIGDTLNLHANTEEGATGNWQILQGVGGFLSAPNDAYTRFSGIDTLYRLRWTLTNGCGSDSDDIEVRFVHTVVSDRVVMVDTTDIIFSDSAQMAQGYYVISFSDPNIVIGDSTILVSLINGGFMRMVDSWSMANDSTYAMHTSQASLFDILESGVIQFDALPAAENADSTVSNGTQRQQRVEFLDHIPTRTELRSNPDMTKSGTVYVMHMDLEDNNGNRVNLSRGNSRRGDNDDDDDDKPTYMKLKWKDPYLGPDFEYKLDSGHFNLDLNPVFEYDKDNRHFRFGLYGAYFSVGADIVPKFTPVELEVTPVEFVFLKIPEVAFAVPVGPIVIPFTVDCGASVEVKGTIGASVEARYRFNAEATFTYGVNYWGRYNDFTIDKSFDGDCNMGRVGNVNTEGSVELEAKISGYANVKLAGVVGPRVKAGYKFKVNQCFGGSSEAGKIGGQGKLTSELFLKLDLKGIKLVDKIIPKNWSKEWTLPIGKKHTFPDTMYLYSKNLTAQSSNIVKVKVLGSGGRPTHHAFVLFRPQDGGTVSHSSAFTDKNGIAQTVWVPGPSRDVHQLYAYAYDCEQNPIKGSPVVFTVYELTDCDNSTLDLKYHITGNTLTLQAEGGVPPYTYSVNGGDFVSLDNLPTLSALAGHVLSVKDDNGCIRTLSYGYVNNTNCAWSDLGIDAEYSNDALILQGIDGTPPYKYSLDGNNYSTNNIFPSLSPGVYTAYVIDDAGCEYNKEVTVEDDEIADLTPIILQACPEAPTVTDLDSNTYNTVRIGNQCWMRENLRTTHYADGTPIPAGDSITSSSTAPYYYDYNSSGIPLDQRGYHYNWPAVMHGASSSNANPSGVQGICPTGWHIPSNAEWTKMTDYLSSQDIFYCDNNPTYIAKVLASTTGWNSYSDPCAVGNDPSFNNATGFSAVPAGYYRLLSGHSAYFWSSTQSGNSSAYGRTLGYSIPIVIRNGSDKSTGYSVRCLRDEPSSAAHAPMVTTDSVTSVTATSATLNGSITNPDSVTIIAQGFEWKATNGGSYTQVSATGSSMSYTLTGLTASTDYTYRAFVTTASDTIYGIEVSFTTTADTAFTCGTSKVADVDGNMYNTIQLGYQCWMKENLRTTKKPDSSDIALNNERFCPNNDANNVADYGYLYTWSAMMNGAAATDAIPSGVQGICPAGWHVPSDAEWTWLTYCVSCHSEYQCGYINYIAKAMASTTGWNSSIFSCAVGNDQNSNNATGFGASPAGYYCKDNYGSFGSSAFFWTTKTYAFGPYFLALTNSGGGVTRGYDGNGRTRAHSVRCLRDDSGSAAQAPTVTTDNASFLAATSAMLNSSITNPDYVPVTAQGFEWKVTDGGSYTQVSDPWLSATRSTMSYALTGLTPSTTYTYRAFITTSFGTTYGNEVSFTTTSNSENRGQPCPGSPTVTDNDGNIYNTVQIGNQCWMKENLRTTKKPDGSDITLGSDRFIPNDDTNNVAVYGYLYKWYAMLNGYSYSYTNPSGVQGICPTGWHVPSDAEWTQMTDYVSSQSEYQCNNDSSYIAKALAANIGWRGSSSVIDPCHVHVDQSSNNATGFSALPAGYYEPGWNNIGPHNFGGAAFFWSCTPGNNDSGIGRYIQSSTTLNVFYVDKSTGRSVRCLRD